MRSWTRWTTLTSAAGAIALAVAPGIGLASVTACGDDCSCPTPEVDVVVPPSTAGDIVSVEASGVACSGVTATCDETTSNGCIDYAIVPNVAGECDVTVIFSDATQLSKSFTFGGTPTCCGDLGGGGQLDAIHPTDGGAG